MKVNITQESLFEYLAEVDPVLRQLEALTNQLIDARRVLNAATVSGPQIIALIEACEGAPDVLRELSRALLDARGRLAGIVEQASEDREVGDER